MGVYGLLGKTLGHSFSPRLHAYLADYEYRLFEKTEEELPDFLRGGDFAGLNVTIPYKQTVMPYCAALSPLAKKIGSVNTILRRGDGSLYGDNTDAAGFLSMLEGLGVSAAGKKALVLGSGGAAKTVCAVLKLKNRIPGHKASITEDFQVMKDLVLERRRTEFLHDWVVKKIKSTYVRLNEQYCDCQFEYEGWVR